MFLMSLNSLSQKQLQLINIPLHGNVLDSYLCSVTSWRKGQISLRTDAALHLQL